MDYRIYLDLLSYRWTHEILTALKGQPRRHTEILHAISPSPSPKVLSESLVRLQDHGLVHRGTGGDAAYELTDAGRAFQPLVVGFLEELRHWGEQYMPAGSTSAGRPDLST